MLADLSTAPPAKLLPVHFDFGAAQRAAQALRAAADAVDRSAQLRVRDARGAEASWRGNQRDRFDQAENQVASAASALVNRMRRAADKLHDAAADARKENTRRARALDEWRQDQAEQRQRESAARARTTK